MSLSFSFLLLLCESPKQKENGEGQTAGCMSGYCSVKGAMLEAWGSDGEIVQVAMPSETDVSNLVSASEEKYRNRLESAKRIPEEETVSGHKGVELPIIPVVLKSGDWELQVVPWIGGRILSMDHIPSGIVNSTVIFSFRTQWLHS